MESGPPEDEPLIEGAVGVEERLLEMSARNGSAASETSSTVLLKPYQRLFVDHRTMERSILALRFAVFIDGLNLLLLAPNYPFLVTLGYSPDSFPSIAPFDYSAAVFFLRMVGAVGMALSSLVIGRASDRLGRKPCVMFCLVGSIVGGMLKYFLRGNFWTFNAASFVNGLASGTVPVAAAYIGDVMPTQVEKQVGETGQEMWPHFF